ENYLKDLEISDRLKKTSDITAISDLVKKIQESLNVNKKKIRYLEEDYFRQKNQIDNVTETINEHKKKIKELTNYKKKCFSQINRVTREMSGNSVNKNEKLDQIIEFNGNLTNAQKIRALQKSAKEAQNEINKLNSEISQNQSKYDELSPIYESYKKDYEGLIDLIKTDEKKIKDLQNKLNEKINADAEEGFGILNGVNLKSVRPKQEIQADLKQIKSKLEEISIPKSLVNSQNPEDLTLITNKVREIEDSLKFQKKEMEIRNNENELNTVFESFQTLELEIEKLESFINKFLIEINLKSYFRIHLNQDNHTFLLHTHFVRNNRDKLTFRELTTPEKIFFIIIYYISIDVQIKNKNIVFSNLFLPSNFNKAGSIYRTIRKMLPIFENEKNLSSFKLIFILSNLELKKDIKKLNIITIQENEL
ncbi:MAG: hypothetical protein ACFFG0_51240, partial [Candidatus Thorarchaeota archaeon]